MSLQFIIGRAGSGKTHTCLEIIREKLREEPTGSPIIYLVPDQMTFQMEYDLINTPGIGGMMRAQVFSFTRLAWRVLQETGGMSRYHVNNVGVNMILRKIIEARKQDLKVFSRAADKNGFITQMEEMVAEFKRYCITPEQLEEQRHQLQNEQNQVLTDKLHDLKLLYVDLEKHLFEKYVDSEDYLRLLAEKIPQSNYIKEAEILIDGFHSYTPQELEVLGQLMKVGKKVTIALTVDKAYDGLPPHDLSLFRMTGTTYQSICQLASEDQIKVEEPIFLREQMRFVLEPSLTHLEAYFDERPTVSYSGKAAITLAQAVNRRAEIEGIAREIQKLVREQNYRYREIALLVRNAGEYHEIIETIFQDYQIPFFIDQKRSMLNHPLIELIRSSLEVITGNWRYEAVFRCVKTDLLYPFGEDITKLREDMDKLENYVLEYGIQGYKWTSDKRWKYKRFRGIEEDGLTQTNKERDYEDMLNDLRQMIVEPLLTLQKRLQKAKTGRSMCEALFLYLEELEIPAKMEELKLIAEMSGRLSEARENDQVWNSVLELLDQFVEIMADEKVEPTLFCNMLETGIESMRFALVPPAIDQVLIASLERSRFSNIKCTFIIGANDGVIPARPNEEGVFSEKDREMLGESGMRLAPGSRVTLLDENFLIYCAITSPSDQLFISYPLANEEGKSLLPSTILKRLKEIFPNMNEKFYLNEPSELAEENQLEYIVNPNVSLSYLATQLQAWKKQYPIKDLWWDVYNYFVNIEDMKDATQLVLNSLFYKNKPNKLSREITKALYGDHIQGSVSRMEVFQGCAFSHFANYGLHLRDRKVFRLESPDIGELFHAALKEISDSLREKGLDWRDITKAQCDQLAADAVEALAPKLQNEILLSSNRYHYIMQKLQKIISRASSILSEHAKASGFAPIGMELGFGKKGPLPPIQFTLDNGSTMELVGRIDRVDKAESSKGVLLRVVDYKSSQKSLDLAEVYYGLALQMLTYLDVIISSSKEWIGTTATPAGVVYFHVHDPLINANKAMPEDKIEEEIFKRFKMKGLLLGDEETVRLMDQTLDTGYSQIVSAAIKKDGSFYSTSQIASEEDIGHLRNHVRGVFKNTGNRITNGEIDIAPYKLKDKTPCTFCAFKSVCQFDQSLEDNNYRVLSAEKNDVVLDKIRNGGAGIHE
ncbi:helicase-exonuclease AddAB subunit AddB [Fredinandcohnia quinoae]|uniref:ATP-dependent helicase/deoxyribonuclease subunit B n=1 Tax=Fredinandcohnia quinoae TaxID=2918902 RepID=A0AAW5E3K3_9BACI|nr:helicase-exonuclease AddAB subunit AddB [Fredinandcohnia sp. SECRCQ15]MCH1625820.1 helicase-exonuclease AddAB subunit AddB [Fredinandcohnia sp. SECRCQ15]